MKAGDRVGDYLLKDNLGQGETGSTWLALRSPPGGVAAGGAAAEAVLKILDLGEAKGWSGYDLFLREVEALKGLSHPGIPRFLGSFEDSRDGGTRLVLAMERKAGQSLESAVAKGRRFSEEEVSEILARLAVILAYLGSLRPPVVHRDINPRNVLLAADGSVSLVDFSGAQDAILRGSRPGATLIGTAGYIPLEQVSGRASARSDRYGAAATALFLLTRSNPADLPLRDLKPDLSLLPALGDGLSAVLESWLEPDEARRGLEPAQAALILRGEAKAPAMARPRKAPSRGGKALAASLPSNSKVRIEEAGSLLRITIPPLGLGSAASLGAGGFTVFWLGFVAFWTFSAAAMGAPVAFVLFSLPFWAVGIALGRTTLRATFLRTELVFDPEAGLTVSRRFIGPGRAQRCPAADLGECVIVNSPVRTGGRKQRQLAIEAGAKSLRVGTGLSERELNAIRAKIEAWRRDMAHEAPIL
jgi:hypothetical protein